jgi:hypothetical protein
LENSVPVVDDIVVPNADHAIAVGAKCAIAVPVSGTFRVLAAVELDKQAPLAADAPSLTQVRQQRREG